MSCRFREGVEATTRRLLSDGEGEVCAAMEEGVLGGGKRFRAYLALSSSRACGGEEAEGLYRTASALEMVHAYSLSHDDLPCMDDAKERRGGASLWVKYGEATAILAGDGLLTEAFGVLASSETHADAEVRAGLCELLSRGAGRFGMVGGQALDMGVGGVGAGGGGGEGGVEREDWERTHRLKTGALMGAACGMGALWGCGRMEEARKFWGFGEEVGLAYQLRDDAADGDGASVSMGREGALCASREAMKRALGILEGYGLEAEGLREAARYAGEGGGLG